MDKITRAAADSSENAVEVGLRAIVIVYLVLGALYATLTPSWQAPDEPAHYNYVRYVAETGQLPELRLGDYPFQYLESIKARHFPADMSIEPIRYESYQPPAYYVLAAVVYRLAAEMGNLPMPLTLRALSLLLGAATLVAAFRLVRSALPGEPVLALGTAAFMAVLPMHLAMTAAVNNDVLTGLLLTVIVGQLVAMRAPDWTRRRAFALGALLGLATLSKLWSYSAFAVALLALVWDWSSSRHSERTMSVRSAATSAAIMLGTAALVALPWLLHNVSLYGLGDPFGFARHDQVVVGQLTTRQYIAQYGLLSLLHDLALTTFQSFWGQFGWMGVLLDQRIYLAFALLSALAAIGLGLYAVTLVRQERSLTAQSQRALLLLVAWGALTTLGYLGYNIKFVQHQGRYLFLALAPWGLAFTIGLREVLRGRGRPVVGALVLAVVGVVVAGLFAGDVSGFALALVLGTGAALWAGRKIEQTLPGAAIGLVYAGIAALAIICLYAYIVPALRPLT